MMHYIVVNPSNTEAPYTCCCRVQDGTERWTERTLESAIQSLIKSTWVCNRTRITERDIKIIHECQTSESKTCVSCQEYRRVVDILRNELTRKIPTHGEVTVEELAEVEFVYNRLPDYMREMGPTPEMGAIDLFHAMARTMTPKLLSTIRTQAALLRDLQEDSAAVREVLRLREENERLRAAITSAMKLIDDSGAWVRSSALADVSDELEAAVNVMSGWFGQDRCKYHNYGQDDGPVYPCGVADCPLHGRDSK